MTINRLGAALPAAIQIGEINNTDETIVFDCLGYTFLSVQVFSSGSAIIESSISNDKIDWVEITLDTPSNLGDAAPTPLIWSAEYKVSSRYLRLSFPALSTSLKASGFFSSASWGTGGGGGGGGGDASYANQVTEIARLEAIRDRLPSALVGDRLKVDGSETTQPVIGAATSGVILSLQTHTTGANFTAFASQTCKQLDLVNLTGTQIEYRRDGSGDAFPIPNGSGRLIVGITNANAIAIRRTDQSNTQVTVKAEALS